MNHKQRIYLINTVLILIALFVFNCCNYRYTKAFRLPEYLNKSWEDAGINYLDDEFDSWSIFLRVLSTFNSNKSEEVNSNKYEIYMAFILSEYTSIWQKDSIGNRIYVGEKREEVDTCSNVIVIDTLYIVFLPTKTEKILVPKRRDWKRRIFFGDIYIPPDVEELNVSFTVKMYDKTGIEVKRQRYKCNLLRYEYKWNDWLPLE